MKSNIVKLLFLTAFAIASSDLVAMKGSEQSITLLKDVYKNNNAPVSFQVYKDGKRKVALELNDPAGPAWRFMKGMELLPKDYVITTGSGEIHPTGKEREVDFIIDGRNSRFIRHGTYRP